MTVTPENDLREFVTTQAAQDAVLPEDEHARQAEIVEDVLGQELSPGMQQELMALYQESKEANSLSEALV